MTSIASEILQRLQDVVGPQGWSTDADVLAPRLVEGRGLYHGTTPLLLRPKSTDEVAAIVGICAETRTPIVPQGGNTGLVGGQTPAGEVLLSLDRMRDVRGLDVANAALTVEAGLPLAAAQEVAADHDLLLAVSLASEGTATVGGIVSTNAGGTNVLKYGMTREQVLGLEVVLPSGVIWNGLTALRKDNTGYDLKQLFIGAEGTLGIVTAATFRLHPAPRDVATAFCAVPSPRAAVELLRFAQGESGDGIVTFELMPRFGVELSIKHAGARDPLQSPSDWYVLVECAAFRNGAAHETLQRILEGAVTRELVRDAALAASGDQAAGLWAIREQMSELQKREGGSIKHDISVPVSAIADFLDEAMPAIARACPGVRFVPFGHLGDGNLHFNLSQPEGADKDAFLTRWEELNALTHDIVVRYGGSISAEHGIGQLKRGELARLKSAPELQMMKGIKQALDPLGIMNPGRIL